jgi:hypothetical protein
MDILLALIVVVGAWILSLATLEYDEIEWTIRFTGCLFVALFTVWIGSSALALLGSFVFDVPVLPR